jgi:predicted esterase
MSKPIHVKPSLYAYHFYNLKEIALKYGYNLVLHGSLNRDLDLIAIPWQTDLGNVDQMIIEFAAYLDGSIMEQTEAQRNLFRYFYNSTKMKRHLIHLILFFICHSIFAQQVPVTIPVTSWGTTANGYVYVPHDYAKQKSCPVVIFFHGVGEAGTDPTKLLNQGLPQLLNLGMKLDSIINPSDGRAYSFIAISLQGSSWSANPSWVPYEIAYLKSHYRIDESRIYLTGLSAGGINSFISLQTDTIAKTIAAAAPMSVPNTDFKDGQFIAKYKIKTWFFVGLQDYAYNTTYYSYKLCDSVYPGSSKLTYYPCGHGCWNDHYNVNYRDNISGLSLWQWFLTNQLKASTIVTLPTHFLNVSAKQINDHQIEVSFNAADVNAKQFFIEISIDGIHFRKVTVIVPDNSNPYKTYTQIIDL